MGKGRRNPRQKAAYFIKAIASYHGNLCVHLQDADTSHKLEHALENLKIDQKTDENFSVGEHVLVAITESGTRKFRRATIDTDNSNSLDATDLDTNEYYADLDRGNVYNLSLLENKELIEAQGAQPYYVHGYHRMEIMINPKKLDKALRASKGVRWFFERTEEKHHVDEEIPVIKLFKENKNNLTEILSIIKHLPRGVSGMPPVFCGSIEEVRVYHSAETLGVQLRYLPLHELRRLEVFLTEALEPEAWKTCDAVSTQAQQLVAAPYDGRMVRGLVAEVRPAGANVYLMDYGIYKRFRFPALRLLHEEYAFKLPAYGLCVKLGEEPEDYYDDRIIKVELKTRIDEFTWEGSIVEIVDDIRDESPECQVTDATAEAAQPDGGSCNPPVPDVEVGDSEENAVDPPEVDISLSRELADYIGSTNEEFVGSNDESLSSPVAQAPSMTLASESSTVSEEATNQDGTDCAGPSSIAPKEPERSEVHFRERVAAESVCLEEEGRTEEPAISQLISQDDVSTADDGFMSVKDEIGAPVARDVGNDHEVPDGQNQMDPEDCQDPEAIHDDSNEQPEAQYPVDGEQGASEDLPILSESPLDAASSQSPQTDADESKTGHPETENESAVWSPEIEAAPVATDLQNPDANVPEVTDASPEECSVEEQPPILSSIRGEKSEVMDQLQHLSETPTRDVATLSEEKDALMGNSEAAANLEVEVFTSDVRAVPTLAAEEPTNDPGHGGDEDTNEDSIPTNLPEVRTDALAAEEPEVERPTCGSPSAYSGCRDENLAVLGGAASASRVSMQVVDIGCSQTETFAEGNVIPCADSTVAADHVSPATQGEADVRDGVDPHRESVPEVEPVVELAKRPEDAATGDTADNQKLQITEGNPESGDSRELSPRPDAQVLRANHGRGDGVAIEVQYGNVALVEDISLTLHDTDNAVIVRFGPSRSRKLDAHCNPSNPANSERAKNVKVSGNIHEPTVAPVVDHGSLPPELAETKIAAVIPVDSALGSGKQSSEVQTAQISAERLPAAKRRGSPTGATNQASLGLQSEDVLDDRVNPMGSTCEPFAGQFDDAVEDVPEGVQAVENEAGMDGGPDTLPVAESDDLPTDGGDPQPQTADSVDSARCEAVPEKTRQVSANDALPGTNTAEEERSRTSESSLCRKKEAGIDKARENSKIYPTAVRDFCEFPELSFNTRRVLIAKIIRVVNSRHVLMQSDVILAGIEEQLDQISNPQPETYITIGKTFLVEHNGKLRRACLAESNPGKGGNTNHVYLLDYPECLSVLKLYRCPPALAAMHRALLFVKLMGKQHSKTEWVGKYFSLYIDRFEGSVITGLVLREPDRKYETALPATKIAEAQVSG